LIPALPCNSNLEEAADWFLELIPNIPTAVIKSFVIKSALLALGTTVRLVMFATTATFEPPVKLVVIGEPLMLVLLNSQVLGVILATLLVLFPMTVVANLSALAILLNAERTNNVW